MSKTLPGVIYSFWDKVNTTALVPGGKFRKQVIYSRLVVCVGDKKLPKICPSFMGVNYKGIQVARVLNVAHLRREDRSSSLLH